MDQPSSALEALLAREPAIWRGGESRTGEAGLPSGYPALDAALPANGWHRGSVTELLTDAHGIGELSLLLPALHALTTGGQWAAFVNPPYLPYAPALANAGLGLERLLVVDSGGDDADALWAAEQLLRAGALGAVVLWVTRTTPARQRRLQLAAEDSGCLAVVYRPASARGEHSPVGARLVLGVRDGRLALDIVKARGGRTGGVVIDPAAFAGPQGVEWPLPPPPSPSFETAAIVALPATALSDRSVRFTRSTGTVQD